MEPLLKVGDTFPSFQEFRKAIENYEKLKNVQFCIRECKRLHRASPGIYELIKHRPELEYVNVRFNCLYGGKSTPKQNVSGSASRKSRGTFKQGCKAEIYAKLTRDRTKLIVTRMDEEHNHEIFDRDFYKYEKRVSTKQPNSQIKMLRRFYQDEGICLEKVMKSKNSLARSKNFEKITNLLQQTYDCKVDLQYDENNMIYGFFFQDQYMKNCFDLFPEFVSLDGTFKLQNIRCFLYLLSIEDSMGESHIVGVGVLTVDDEKSFSWLLQTFKKCNKNWKNIEIIITDHQTYNYDLSNYFHHVETLICTNQAVYEFRKKLMLLKNLTTTEIQQTVEFFKKLQEARNEQEYETILKEVEDEMKFCVFQYFNEKWNKIRYAWVKNLSKPRCYLKAKLESRNSRFRSSIASCKSFQSFIEILFRNLYSKRNELRTEFYKINMKVLSSSDFTETKTKFSKCLTLHAFNKLAPKLNLVEEKQISFSFNSDNSHVHYDSFRLTDFSCSCSFFTVLKLPCEHLLAYRQTQNLDLFNDCLFSQRWTKRYIRDLYDNQIIFCHNQELFWQEKLSEADIICSSLVNLCCKVPQSVSTQRLNVLRQLKTKWENEKISELECEAMDEDESEEIIVEVTS